MRFDIQRTDIEGLVVVERRRLNDDRGYLERLFCAEEFAQSGLMTSVAQINRTVTRRKGAVRGMHFQRSPHEEAKFVTCCRGEVFDVAVDLRRSSATFLCWRAERLSADNKRSFFIPEGFAHGFQTLTEDCELLYLHSTPYAPSAEDGLHPADPRLGIDWPLPIAEMSEKDSKRSFLPENFHGFGL